MMQMSPELEALARADDIAISDKNSRKKQYFGMGLFSLAGIAMATVMFASGSPVKKDFIEGDEEFQTTGFRAPSFLRDEKKAPEKPAQEILKLPEPAAPPPPVIAAVSEFNVPPPPPSVQSAPVETAAAPSTPEALVPADEFPARFKSSQVVLDATKGASAGSEGGQNADDNASSVAGSDEQSKYLAALSKIGDRSAKAGKIARIDAMIPEGTLIPGILETAINSDLPGQIRAIISEDVYSFDGRRVLLPTGTRLIGEYQSEITTGQTRIFVVWTRLIRDDGVSVRFNSIGSDSLGRSGMTGFVDKKFKERFGAAIVLSVVGGVTSFVTGLGSDAVGAATGATTQQAEETARQTIAETFSDMAKDALSDQLKIPPTIHVDQGERIFVYVRQDLDFSALYQDPVDEELEAIKRERGLN
jgi:type IV secretion system protein VirB10